MSARAADGVQRAQELVYGGGHDYRRESPHLKHQQLYEQLLAEVRAALVAAEAHGLEWSVLEIGAGDGAFVGPLLSYGCRVTATEMSRPSIERLLALYGRNAAFEVLFDPEGSLAPVGHERYALVLFASVLHHIPDYLATLRTALPHVRRGGSLVSLQDPLYYPRLGWRHAVSEAAFLSWRLGQGNLLRGVRSRVRRARGAYRPDDPSDVVEYHVVRDGVDEEAVRSCLEPEFTSLRILRYWSTVSTPWQRLGERLPLHNTFAVVAQGRR